MKSKLGQELTLDMEHKFTTHLHLNLQNLQDLYFSQNNSTLSVNFYDALYYLSIPFKGSHQKKNCVFCDINIKGGWVPVSKPNFLYRRNCDIYQR